MVVLELKKWLGFGICFARLGCWIKESCGEAQRRLIVVLATLQ